MYLIFALVAGIIGGLLSIAIRRSCRIPGLQIFHEHRTNTMCSPPRTA